MTKVVRDAIGWERLFGSLFGSFAIIALFLASIGLYGVIAYGVAQRTREIGVRMAMGARPQMIVVMIPNQGARVVAVGLALGLLAAWFIAAKMAGMLYGVSAHDVPTFLGVPLLLMTVGLFACGLPARRAAKIDPVITLRSA
jgi:putative ABC transport system permease protein